MKRILLIMALTMMLPTVVFAQRGIPRSNNVSVSSTVVTRTPKAKTYDAKVGFQQLAGLLAGMGSGNIGGGVSYIGGYRFNNYIFLGAGADLFFTDNVDIPFYVHSRFYISRYNWRPYAAISLCRVIDLSLGVDVRVHEKFNMYFGIGGGIDFGDNMDPTCLGKIGFSF